MAGGRAFTVALGISLAFHLSMVTVFSIVVYFPHKTVHYYPLSIVEPKQMLTASAMPIAAPTGRDLLRVPSPSLAPTRQFLEPDEPAVGIMDDAALPDINLPTIEFAELRRLRIRELAIGQQYGDDADSLLSDEPQDSWARFTRELGHIGRMLRGNTEPEESNLDQTQPKRLPITRPALGFEAFVEWIGAPKDRELLFAPPIEAFWGVSADTLAAPIVLEFTVNEQGRVVSAWSPDDDNTGLITAAQETLLKYRFAPVDGVTEQHATLRIAAARTVP